MMALAAECTGRTYIQFGSLARHLSCEHIILTPPPSNCEVESYNNFNGVTLRSVPPDNVCAAIITISISKRIQINDDDVAYYDRGEGGASRIATSCHRVWRYWIHKPLDFPTSLLTFIFRSLYCLVVNSGF